MVLHRVVSFSLGDIKAQLGLLLGDVQPFGEDEALVAALNGADETLDRGILQLSAYALHSLEPLRLRGIDRTLKNVQILIEFFVCCNDLPSRGYACNGCYWVLGAGASS